MPPRQPAPLTPELEALINGAAMVPVTVACAHAHFRGQVKYLHDATQADMDLQPWRACQLVRQNATTTHANCHRADPVPLKDDAIVFVTRADFDQQPVQVAA